MAGITTRTTAGAGATVKNAVLTAAEMDANFLGINDEIFVDGLPTVKPSLVLDFVGSAQIDPRITFTRASTATFYDAGSTVKAEENLLQFSERFENGYWSKFNVTVAADATAAPDGTATADKLVETAVTDAHSVYASISLGAASWTFSFYAKAAERTWAKTRGFAENVFFDLANGVLGSVPAGTTASITNVGNGWYRCAVTRTDAASSVQIAATTGNGVDSYLGVAGNGIFIWGAQLEQRSQATAYTPTTTSAITRYQPRLMTAPANAPRLDFDAVTREPSGFLVELGATNLLVRSEEFDQGPWANGLGNCSVTANVAVAPSGAVSGDLVLAAAAGAASIDYRSNNAVTVGSTYTASIYVKAASALVRVGLSVDVAWAQGGTSFDLVGNGTVVAGPGSISHVGNGWYRLTTTATLTQQRADVGLTFTATSNQSGFYVWGAQLETGSFATSYIPTTSAQVTRAPDIANITGSNFTSWYNYQEGTQYVESRINEIFPGVIGFTYAAPGPEFYRTNQVDTWVIGVGRQLSSSRMRFATAALGQGLAYNGASAAGGSGNADADADLSTNRNYWKFAAAIKSGDSALYWRSTLAQGGSTSSAAGRLPEPIALGFGSNAYLYARFSGHIRKFVYYPKRLTNTQLQYLIK